MYYLLKWIKFSLKRNKTLKKYWKSRGIFSVWKNGNRGFLRKCTLHVQRMHFTNICVMDLKLQIQYAKNHIDGVTGGVTERMTSAKQKLSYIWEEINKDEEQVAADETNEVTKPSQVNAVVS